MHETGIVPALHYAPLRDRDGVVAGSVVDLLADAATHRPAWLVVALDDGRRTVVPARGSRPVVGGMRVPHDAATVRSCPAAVGADGLLAREHVVRVCRHYGVALPP